MRFFNGLSSHFILFVLRPLCGILNRETAYKFCPKLHEEAKFLYFEINSDKICCGRRFGTEMLVLLVSGILFPSCHSFPQTVP